MNRERRAKLEQVLSIGTQLSNVIYNLKNVYPRVDGAADLVSEWDRARRELREALKPPSKAIRS